MEQIMTKYRIVFVNNTGSRAVEGLAFSCGGSWSNSVERFDGTNDLAYIECPEESAEHLESMLEDDNNVVSYSVAA